MSRQCVIRQGDEIIASYQPMDGLIASISTMPIRIWRQLNARFFEAGIGGCSLGGGPCPTEEIAPHVFRQRGPLVLTEYRQRPDGAWSGEGNRVVKLEWEAVEDYSR